MSCIHNSPSGEHYWQLMELKKESDKHGKTMETSPFTRHDAWTLNYAMWLTSMGYPLPSCSFTFSKLDDTQRKAISAIISRCAFNRHTHQAITFGPSSLGGGANFCPTYRLNKVFCKLLASLNYIGTYQHLKLGQLLQIAVS
jgi:hypothetical protein